MDRLLEATTAESTATKGADGSIFLSPDASSGGDTMVRHQRPTDDEIKNAKCQLDALFTGTPEEVAKAERLYTLGRQEAGKDTEAAVFYRTCETLAGIANYAYDIPRQ